jgi:hypothetical protein
VSAGIDEKRCDACGTPTWPAAPTCPRCAAPFGAARRRRRTRDYWLDDIFEAALRWAPSSGAIFLLIVLSLLWPVIAAALLVLGLLVLICRLLQ